MGGEGSARQTRGASTWILKMSHNERSTSGCRGDEEENERERERETLLRLLFLHPRVLTISPRQLRFLFNRARFEVTNYHRRGNSNRPSGCRAACISLRLKDTRLIERDNLMVPCSGIGPGSGEKKMRASTSRDFSLSLSLARQPRVTIPFHARLAAKNYNVALCSVVKRSKTRCPFSPFPSARSNW